MTTPTVAAPPRPPRQRAIPSDLLDRAVTRMGMRRDEIIQVLDVEAGLVVTTKDGATMIDVPADRPDRHGGTGLLWVARPGRPVPALALPWTPHKQDEPVLAQITAVDLAAEPWTVKDLDTAARAVQLRPDQLARGLAWVAGDPIRARAWWLRIVEEAGFAGTGAAAVSNPLCAQLHRVVVESGWLAAGETNRL